MVCCFGTGKAESGSASSGSLRLRLGRRFAAAWAPARRLSASWHSPSQDPIPSALTFTLGPICMAVNDIALPPLENSITTMLDLLITEGCSFQPSAFSDAAIERGERLHAGGGIEFELAVGAVEFDVLGALRQRHRLVVVGQRTQRRIRQVGGLRDPPAPRRRRSSALPSAAASLKNLSSASFLALARAASADSFTCATRLTNVRSYLGLELERGGLLRRRKN